MASLTPLTFALVFLLLWNELVGADTVDPTMSLLQKLLHLTNFHSPLLRNVVPSIAAAFAIQTAFAVPSVATQSERFYDFSGAITNIAVAALSLYLPVLRARYATAPSTAAVKPFGLPSLLEPFTSPATAALNWRQVVLTGAATIWAIRLGSYLFQRVLQAGKDSRFDEMKKSPPKFFAAWMAQAMWSSIILMPVIALNAVPGRAFSTLSSVRPIDVLGLAVWAGGFGFEILADRQKSQWMQDRRNKLHDEQFMTRGLWSRCRYPNYFGESTLWTGIATTAAGALAVPSIQRAIGLSGGVGGALAVLSLSFASPAFTSFLLLKLSGVPLSEPKYDKRYGDRKDYQEWKKNTPLFFPKVF